jgi:hypothetical protein
MNRWTTTLALAALAALAACSFAGSTPARVRYWSWRMGSSDPSVRAEARGRLLELGRTAISGVHAELVASEVADRVAAIGSSARVFVPRAGFEGGMTDIELYSCNMEIVLRGSSAPLLVEASFMDRRWALLSPPPLREALRRGHVLFVTDGEGRLELTVPLEENESGILEAVRARLGTDSAAFRVAARAAKDAALGVLELG